MSKSKSLSYEQWAEFVIERWIRKIETLDIGQSQQLKNSFISHVFREANGDATRIEFLYNYYGRFVDMGVGRGITTSDVGVSKRKAKKWYSPVLSSQIKKLTSLLGEKNARQVSDIIIDAITNSMQSTINN